MRLRAWRWVSRAGRRAPNLCLCLLLTGWWGAAAPGAVAQGQGPAAAGPAAELGEALRLNEQAFRLYKEGRYAEAVPLIERSLAIRERAFGPDHPQVAASLNNLAELYLRVGDFVRAEPLYQRALAIWVKVLGPDHPNVATT